MDTPQYSCDRLAFHFDNQKSREMKAANALGAKTARACHSCLRRRASWFCAADDAFLCQGCDNLVHSANQLARRHERVRLQTASSSKANWFSGFKRKARSPRHSKHLLAQQRPKDEEEELFNNISTLPVVPDLGNEEPLLDETEDQLLCRVPVFDPFDEVLCDVYSDGGDEILETTMKKDVADDEEITCDLDNFSEFLSSDVDLAEFAADVESLLGSGVDEDSGEMKGSELFDGGGKSAMMKVKDENHEADETACYLESFLDMTSEALNWNIIDSQSPAQEEEEKVVAINDCVGKVETENKNIFLRLNYEEVITAWASQGSPWTTGNLPQFNSHDCWPDFLGLSGGDVQRSYGEVGRLRGQIVDGGREARVSRYREKRRTRLFAKKIRYEVRKLNAEKRPRMKGRFVKRTSFVGGATTALPAYH